MLPSFKQAAIDGKTLRGSTDGDKSPLHMVSAFATDFCIVLGEEAVADKSNRITVIPLLLEALAVKGCLMSIDLMGCQNAGQADVGACCKRLGRLVSLRLEGVTRQVF